MDWKRDINLTKNETLGLDIGSSAVKMVALRKNGEDYSAIAAGIAEIAVSDDGDERQRTNTVKAVRRCFAQTRVKRKLAVCGVSGPDVAVRDFELPSLEPEEMAAAVSLEASQVCPFPSEDSAIAYQLMPNGNDNTRGILVAAMNMLVADRSQLVKESRLKCVLMDVDGLALLNCYKGLANDDEETEAGRTAAILNVGGSKTTLAIMDNEGKPFVRDMIHGGDEIVSQIGGETGTPIEDVKEILSGEPAAIEPRLHESLERACQKLISDVRETLRYYVAQGKSSNVDKLLVCGGFALAGGFIELLNNRLGTESVLWNPFESMQCNPNRRYQNVFAKAGPALAVAAGLAMRSI